MAQRPDSSESLPAPLQSLRKAILVAIALALAAFVAVALRDWLTGETRGLPYMRLAAVAAVAVTLAVSGRLGPSRQLAGLMGLVGCGVIAVGAESVLWLTNRAPEPCNRYAYLWKRQRCIGALNAGQPFDGRPALDVLDAARAGAPNTEVFLAPMSIYQHRPKVADRLLPLGSLPTTPTIFCNEDGVWRLHSTDEYGFFNPTGLYGPDNTRLTLIGDSYVAGFCVEESETVGARLRQAGLPTLGLGANGNGPLAELGTAREYLPATRSPDVYWLFYEGNDLRNLEVELHSPLARYLEPSYTQHLVERHDEVTQLVHQLLAEYEAEARAEVAQGGLPKATTNAWTDSGRAPTAVDTLVSLVSLDRLRETTERLRHPPPPHPYDPELVGRIMRLMKRDTEANGGTLTFVYLPSWYRYVDTLEPLPPRADILAQAQQAGLRVLDFAEVLDADPDPVHYFPFRLFGHYTPEGYARLADFIAADVRAQDAAHASHQGG